MKSFGLALLLSCSSLAFAPSFAQAATAAAEQSAGAVSIGEVVVTARRRAERLQDVPVSVTALSAQDLNKKVIQKISDLGSTVPGFNTSANTSTAGKHAISLSLRGIRSSAVTIYSAEVVRNPATMFDEIYDLQSVEVLKGPQGTLFGANSLSGALLIQPQTPTYHFEGFAEARIGNYNEHGGTLAINIPLIDDKIALRIAGDFSKRDGFIKGPNYNYDADNHSSARVSLLVEPIDKLKNTTVYEYYRFSAEQGAAQPVAYFPCTNTGPYASTAANSAPCAYVAPATTAAGLPTFVDAFNAEVANGPYRTNIVKDFTQNITSNAVSNITSYDLGAPLGDGLGDLTFRSILGYQQYNMSGPDNFGLVLDIVEQRRRVLERRKTGEFQIQGKGLGGKLNWVVGAYLSRFKQELGQNSLQLSPFNVNVPITNRSDTFEHQTAEYAQASLEVIDHVTVTAGYRHTETTTTQINRNRVAPVQRCALTNGAPGVDFAKCERTDRLKTNDPSYTLSIDWKFAPDGLLYAVTRRGFNAGGFNPTSLTADTAIFRPETLTDYELGVKKDLVVGDVRLRANASAFLNDYKNMQRRNVINVIVSGAPVSSSVTQNLASSRLTGVEGQVDIFATDAMTLHLGGSHLFEAKYTSFLFKPSAAAAPVDLRGNILGQAPRWTFLAGVDYAFPEIPGVGKPSLNVNYSYQSRFAFLDLHYLNATLTNDYPDNIQKGYGLVNAQVQLENIFGSKADLAIWVKNLTKQSYYSQKSGTFGYSDGTLGDPRRYGMNLSYRF